VLAGVHRGKGHLSMPRYAERDGDEVDFWMSDELVIVREGVAARRRKQLPWEALLYV